MHPFDMVRNGDNPAIAGAELIGWIAATFSTLSRIAQLDQRTALADQCLPSAEADVRPPRRKSGFDPVREVSFRAFG